MKNKTIYLIDGTAYIYRAFHAIRDLSTSDGLPTNAVFGFAKMLTKLIDEQNPDYIGMIFDAKGPTFRHELYPAYKANRPRMSEDMALQIPYIRDITKGFNIPVIELPGYEADDVIGTLANLATAQNFDAVIVSGDKDLLQLISENIILWDPMKDKTTDIGVLEQNFGVKPSQLIDVMGLSGDSTDNVPGVPGIGQKTALNLIKTFGSIENLYARIDEIKAGKQRENLIQYKDQALLSQKLVTIDINVPLSFNFSDFRLKSPDNLALGKLFKTLEFRQFQQAFPVPSDLSSKRYQAILSKAEISGLVDKLKSAELFSLDTETTSENPLQAELVGLSFSIQPNEAFYIPISHDYLGVPEQPERSFVLEKIKGILEDPNIKKIGQNIKYDWTVLSHYGIHLSGVTFDTMLASYLINPGKRTHNLDEIALDFLDHRKISYEDVAGKGKKSVPFNKVSLKTAVPYSCEDSDITLMAYHVLEPKLKKAGLFDLFETVEMPLIPVLMKMEKLGICVDRDRLLELSKSFESRLEALEDQICSMVGERFNINSPQQLGYILFEKLNLPTKKKTKKKTGYSTDVDVLTELAYEHELPALILQHRTLAKLKSTYADALRDQADPKTGRIHTSFNQTVTATGRLSSSDPNLQNIPVRNEEGRDIRSAFIPQDGWFLVSADYSQIELRILAHYSNDPILLKSFVEGEDIHTRTASELFGDMFITPEMRRHAKAINFGIIYGMSAFGLSKELGISRKMAQTYIDSYFDRYKGVREFLDRTIAEAKIKKQTSTLFNRIRPLPEIGSSNRNVRMFAERMAINTPIQGTAADIIKLAMIKVDAAFENMGLKSAMLLSVHDELVFEVPPEELDTVKTTVKKIMESVLEMKAPLVVNIGYGKNWMEAHG